VNWHYLRWQFDTRLRRNVELQVNDLVMDLRSLPVPSYDHPYRALGHLLNFSIDVRTHTSVRNFLFLDSVLVSVDW
jgi:RNase adaptor protein for sRNA GlmZ degradation